MTPLFKALMVSSWLLKWNESCLVVSDSLRPHGLYSPWNSLGQNTAVGNCSLLQGIFLTQGLNPGLPHCRWILYQLSNKGRPRTLEWVAYPFSSRSSQPRNWTGVSCIAGRFFYQLSYQDYWWIIQIYWCRDVIQSCWSLWPLLAVPRVCKHVRLTL